MSTPINKDAALLDFLDELPLPGGHGWLLRQSIKGKGARLYMTTREPSWKTAREAIAECAEAGALCDPRHGREHQADSFSIPRSVHLDLVRRAVAWRRMAANATRFGASPSEQAASGVSRIIRNARQRFRRASQTTAENYCDSDPRALEAIIADAIEQADFALEVTK